MMMITINSKNDMTFGTEFSTWIIAFCPDSDSWFVTNQRFWWYEYPMEFQSEQEGIYYFVSNYQLFDKLENEMEIQRYEKGTVFLENTRSVYGKPKENGGKNEN